MKKILIVDDEMATRNALARSLKNIYECITAADAELALEALDKNPDTSLLLTDYKMPPGMNGVELIREVKRRRPSIGCILITAFADVDLAVKALTDGGADDFITKPILNISHLEARLSKVLKTGHLEKRVAELEEELQGGTTSLEGFIGSSERMREIYKTIRLVAPSSANVLILGPTGTGKELTARAIHRLSPRANGPFIPVECSAFSENIIESELFGSVKGAFTDAVDKAGRFEAADGGTIFLDEIGEISPSTQVKLLRVLQERTVERVGENKRRPVDFRLVAATNRDLAKLVAEGTFREDLYYRLNVIEIHTPPLSEHPEDIATLATRFTKEFSTANGNKVTGISSELIKKLESCQWPGNVRQLRNVIERMVVLSSGGELKASDLPSELQSSPITAPSPKTSTQVSQLLTNSEISKKAKLYETLALCGGNKTKAAAMLGVARRTVQRWLAQQTGDK